MSNVNKSPLTKSRKPLIMRPKTRMRSNKNTSNNNNNSNRPRTQCRSKSSVSNTAASTAAAPMAKDELENLRQKLFQNSENDLSEFSNEELNQVFPHLREYAHKKGGDEDYDEAQRAFDLSERILLELKHRNPSQSNEAEIEQTFSSRQFSFEDEWTKKFENYDDDTEVRRKELEQQHEEQRTSFERVWNEDMPRRYRKPSQRLLQVKKIEKSLAISCEFERAKAIHQEAERIAEEELQAAQENLNRDYEAALQKLVSKQQAELKSFEDTRAHIRNLHWSKYEEEKSAYNNRTLVVATRQKEAEKGYRTSKKTAEPIGTSGTFNGNPERGMGDVLLPPLRPPNDPDFLEEDKRRKKELQKKKLAFQKQNAQATLAKFTVDGQEYTALSEADDQNNNKSNNSSNNNTINNKNNKNNNNNNVTSNDANTNINVSANESSRSIKSNKSSKSNHSSHSKKSNSTGNEKESSSDSEDNDNTKENNVTGNDVNENETNNNVSEGDEANNNESDNKDNINEEENKEGNLNVPENGEPQQENQPNEETKLGNLIQDVAVTIVSETAS